VLTTVGPGVTVDRSTTVLGSGVEAAPSVGDGESVELGVSDELGASVVEGGATLVVSGVG
jgi:hypothetical protein